MSDISYYDTSLAERLQGLSKEQKEQARLIVLESKMKRLESIVERINQALRDRL